MDFVAIYSRLIILISIWKVITKFRLYFILLVLKKNNVVSVRGFRKSNNTKSDRIDWPRPISPVRIDWGYVCSNLLAYKCIKLLNLPGYLRMILFSFIGFNPRISDKNANKGIFHLTPGLSVMAFGVFSKFKKLAFYVWRFLVKILAKPYLATIIKL